MAKTLYDGYTKAQLINWARDEKIRGYTRMNGYQLLQVCQEAQMVRNYGREQALLEQGTVGPGTVLQYRGHPDYVIRVSSGIMQDSMGTYVYSETLSLPYELRYGFSLKRDVAIDNELKASSPELHKDRLYNLEHIPCTEI